MNQTNRVISSGLENILNKRFDMLDHGFIRVVDYLGNDSSIVQAARVSYGSGTKKKREDKGLIRYLMRHQHTTPFEMCEIKFHVKLPIFVARQWIRHRTASVNEYSARYSILDNEFYIPEKENLQLQDKYNKQGRRNEVSEVEAKLIQSLLDRESKNAYENYESMLKSGLARELARMVLPVNFYTQWYWKVNLHNLMNFLKLRVDKHAQYEIRVYAEKMLDILKLWVPITFKAFEDYKINGTTLTAHERQLIINETDTYITFEHSGMSKREWTEFKEKF